MQLKQYKQRGGGSYLSTDNSYDILDAMYIAKYNKANNKTVSPKHYMNTVSKWATKMQNGGMYDDNAVMDPKNRSKVGGVFRANVTFMNKNLRPVAQAQTGGGGGSSVKSYANINLMVENNKGSSASAAGRVSSHRFRPVLLGNVVGGNGTQSGDQVSKYNMRAKQREALLSDSARDLHDNTYKKQLKAKLREKLTEIISNVVTKTDVVKTDVVKTDVEKTNLDNAYKYFKKYCESPCVYTEYVPDAAQSYLIYEALGILNIVNTSNDKGSSRGGATGEAENNGSDDSGTEIYSEMDDSELEWLMDDAKSLITPGNFVPNRPRRIIQRKTPTPRMVFLLMFLGALMLGPFMSYVGLYRFMHSVYGNAPQEQQQTCLGHIQSITTTISNIETRFIDTPVTVTPTQITLHNSSMIQHANVEAIGKYLNTRYIQNVVLPTISKYRMMQKSFTIENLTKQILTNVVATEGQQVISAEQSSVARMLAVMRKMVLASSSDQPLTIQLNENILPAIQYAFGNMQQEHAEFANAQAKLIHQYYGTIIDIVVNNNKDVQDKDKDKDKDKALQEISTAFNKFIGAHEGRPTDELQKLLSCLGSSSNKDQCLMQTTDTFKDSLALSFATTIQEYSNFLGYLGYEANKQTNSMALQIQQHIQQTLTRASQQIDDAGQAAVTVFTEYNKQRAHALSDHIYNTIIKTLRDTPLTASEQVILNNPYTITGVHVLETVLKKITSPEGASVQVLHYMTDGLKGKYKTILERLILTLNNHNAVLDHLLTSIDSTDSAMAVVKHLYDTMNADLFNIVYAGFTDEVNYTTQTNINNIVKCMLQNMLEPMTKCDNVNVASFIEAYVMTEGAPAAAGGKRRKEKKTKKKKQAQLQKTNSRR
jgi:hypothetical protein